MQQVYSIITKMIKNKEIVLEFLNNQIFMYMCGFFLKFLVWEVKISFLVVLTNIAIIWSSYYKLD